MLTRELKGRRVAVLAADGFEKVELSIPVAAMRAAGAQVDIVSLRPGRIRGVNLHEPEAMKLLPRPSLRTLALVGAMIAAFLLPSKVAAFPLLARLILPMRTPTPFDAALAWGELGLKWMEMMTASGAVIAHRTSRRNTPVQLFTMGSEKAEAALESYNAMVRHAMTSVPSGALGAWEAWARLLSSGMAPYHARATRNARRRRSPR